MNFFEKLFKRKPKLTWIQAVQDLKNIGNVDLNRFISACEIIDKLADDTKIPELYELLNHHEFVVREAASIPLARLEGSKLLPFLFDALIRGEDDGHDNDSLVATITDLLELHKKESVDILMEIFNNGSNELRVCAAWGFGFVVPEITADFLLECFIKEKSKEVQSTLAGSLSSFKSNQKIIEELIKNIEDYNEQVRVSVILTLGQIGDKNIIPKLKELLEITTTDDTRFITESMITRLEKL
ncbi:MAG: HEAT repeat domain-containing protein [Anaerolineales bacterium]|nr:HEAT repeat domain-containing protein [Anaerolineales bacterium]